MNGPNNPIGWCDFTWNPVKGKCPVACPYCYARRIYDRFHYDPTIRLDEKELQAPFKLKEPSRIFVGSTIELFGNWVSDKWIYDILQVVKANPQHIFQFLTKYPESMNCWLFPDNCWCGVTVENEYALERVGKLVEARAPNPPKVLFASFEPLHSGIDGGIYKVIEKLDWLIIGAETGNRQAKIIPQKQWTEQVIKQADYWRLPVFMKDNLKSYWHGELRQEFP